MISQLTGAVINIIFDPIMIFGLLGCPALGVAGAAYATVLGQTVAAVVGLVLNLKYNHDINIRLSSIIRPKADIVGQIYMVGVPSILMMSIGSVMTYLMNQILIAFSTTAAAVFGVYFKLQSFFFMPIFGMNNGVIPVLAYNYGAKNRKRIDDALKFAFALAISIMLVGTIVFELIPGVLLKMFDASDDMLAIGIPALRIIAVHFPVAAASIVMGSIFQAFAKSIYSLFVSIGRQLVVLIPVAYLLSLTGNLNAVWFAFPIAEVVSFILSLTFFRIVYRSTVEKM
jgi:Na+-driven multidrug efflux pump